jgi:hypothetical protein
MEAARGGEKIFARGEGSTRAVARQELSGDRSREHVGERGRLMLRRILVLEGGLCVVDLLVTAAGTGKIYRGIIHKRKD